MKPDIGSAGRISWSRLEPFGYEVSGDLSMPLDPDESAAFQALFAQGWLLVAHDQQLDMAEHRRLVAHLGPLGRPEDSVAVLSMQPSEPGAQRGTLEDVELPWHLDGPAMPKPYPGLSLHALDLIDGETATYFASGALAYAALPDDLRRRIEHLRGIHILPAAPERHNTPDDLIGLQDDWPRGVHDLVQVHPVTGVPFLFVGLQATVGVEGLTDEDGEELLQALFASYYRPEAIYEHRWRNGDLVIWDNRATNHRRSDLTGVSRRTLQRVQLADQSFRDAFPDFVPRGSYLKKIFGSYRAEEQVAGPTRSAS